MFFFMELKGIQKYTLRFVNVYMCMLWNGKIVCFVKHYNQVIVEHLDNAFELTYSFVDQYRDYFFSFQFLSQAFDDHHEVFSNSNQLHVILQ